MLDLDAGIRLSVEDARLIAQRRKARRRQYRHGRLYPSIILAIGLVFMYVHFIWHPY